MVCSKRLSNVVWLVHVSDVVSQLGCNTLHSKCVHVLDANCVLNLVLILDARVAFVGT